MLLLKSEDMRAWDRRTIESGHAPGIELMERAGHGVVAAIERRYGSLLGLRALVLCGTGNNGGDGFVVALRLRERGAMVRAVVMGDTERIHGDAATAFEAMRVGGIVWGAANTEAELAAITREADAWDLGVDALLGTGAHGAPTGAIAAGVQALRELDELGTRVIAVDVPTGVDADTGEVARRAVRADLTVTFGSPKRGHALYPGRAFAGALEVIDIGLLPLSPDDPLGLVRLGTTADAVALLPHRDPRAHKGSVGRVLVIGGAAGLTGAITLAARAASRAGAGYVQAATPASLHDIVATKLTEQMPLGCAESATRSLAPAAFDAIVARLEGVNAAAVGPGLSRDEGAVTLVRRIIAEAKRPLVVDADALFALAGATELLASAPAPRVLTPHLGEMSRLTGLSAETLEATRIDAAREWAQRWNVVLALKGAPTVIAAADGRTLVNSTGNAGMATAGMGDVLTGAIAALMAQGLAPFEAVRLAVHVHGAAGDIVAGRQGQLGMTAGDVCEALPLALQALERARVHR